ADCIVEHYVPDYSPADFFQHQLRWARTIRSSRPDGYAGLIFTYAIPWSILTLLVTRGAAWTSVLLVIALILRFTVLQVYTSTVLRGRAAVLDFCLLPV